MMPRKHRRSGGDRRPLPDARRLVADAHRQFGGTHFGWELSTPTGPLMLSTDLGNALDRASERLLHLLRRTVFGLGRDARSRHERLGLDDRFLPLYQDDALESAYATILARPDAILTTDGWRFIEMNVSSAVGGPSYVHLFNEFWRQRGWDDLRLRSPLHDRSTMLAAIVTELDLPRAVDIVGCAADDETYARFHDLEVDELRRAGFDAHYLEAEDYADSTTHRGTTAPLVVQQFVAQDWLDTGRDLAPAVRLQEGNRIVLAPHSAEHVSNKRALALLSAGPKWLTPDDAQFVARHVPWTREVIDGPVDYRGQQHSLVDLLLDQRRRFVLKRSDGSKGEGVHIGAGTDPTEWTARVEEAVAAGTWVVQERVRSVGLPVEVADPETGRTRRVDAPGVFGSVLVDGAASGCLVRYDTAGLSEAEVLAMSVPTVILNCAAWTK